ncbi:MAG TPA: SET domain-containing protein-lysine N-methyltransferase [Bryobacteraceae bacterium]|jgi:SET domain-containing protein|nr:SET domain-containing protein-lysine N-methyltransferase [Bryobacteraceae bacterium]
MSARKASARKTPVPPAIDPKHACFKLEVRPSKIHRWGVYALENIPARRKVIEYMGERINRKETKRRSDEQSRMLYLFTLDNYWTLDGSVGGSGAEYINHCCDPNIVTLVRQGHILYMSKRAIRKGEELTVDYHFAKNVEKVPCRCGADTCRGTINLK